MLVFQITDKQTADFSRDGFLVVKNVVDASTLAAVKAAFTERVEDLLYRYQRLRRSNGTIGSFTDNLTTLLNTAPTAYQHLDISLPMVRDMREYLDEWHALFGNDWHEQAGIFADEAVFQLISHPHIIAIAKHFIDGNIAASPVQHVRIKPPQHLLPAAAQIDANTARTLWHQDEAVISETARGVNILTVWIAINDATVENGCMEAVAGSHKTPDVAARADFGLNTHCPGKGEMVGEIHIPDSEIDKSWLVSLEAKAGDVVLLHKRVLHGAGQNQSRDIRWSFDMRYQSADTVTGRDFFPACPLTGANKVNSGKEYKARWLAARDAILNQETQAVFNTRWDKYSNAPLCA